MYPLFYANEGVNSLISLLSLVARQIRLDSRAPTSQEIGPTQGAPRLPEEHQLGPYTTIKQSIVQFTQLIQYVLLLQSLQDLQFSIYTLILGLYSGLSIRGLAR